MGLPKERGVNGVTHATIAVTKNVRRGKENSLRLKGKRRGGGGRAVASGGATAKRTKGAKITKGRG